jgi:hypothetical protein
LLTPSVVATITGGSKFVIIGGTHCLYTGDGGGASAECSSALPGPTSPADLQALLAKISTNGPGQPQPVTNLGDRALKEVVNSAGGGGKAWVAFYKGDILCVISSTSVIRSGDAMEPNLDTIARKLASSM